MSYNSGVHGPRSGARQPERIAADIVQNAQGTSQVMNWRAMAEEPARVLIAGLFLLPALAAVAQEATPAPAAAAEPAVAPEDASTPDVVTEPLTPPEKKVTSQTITELLERVRTLESEGGPYDPGLGEQLAGLGLAYQENGDHADAVETLTRALQIKRVNEGLQNLDQLTILEALIASNIASEQWEDLDRNYQLLLWIHRRNFDPGDPRFLPIMDKMGRWKLQAYHNGLLDENAETTLRDAESLYSQTVDLLEEEYGETDPRLVDALYGKAATNYQVAREISQKPLESFRQSGGPRTMAVVSYQQVCSATPQGPVCRMVPITTYSSNLDNYVSQQQEKDRAIYQALQRVRQPLKQIVAIYEAHPELPADAYANALVHLADWHLYYEQRTTAHGLYKRAYAALRDSGRSNEDVDKLFDKPVSIPSLRLDLPDVQQKLAEDRASLSVSFDVSKSGRVSNVHFAEELAEQEVARRRIRELLMQATFRPRLVGGEPVDATGVTLKLPVPA